MPNLLKFKRGTAATIPVGSAAEPLFTTDTYDLYIGKGNGSNQRFQKYIASGTSSQFIKGDGSLDSNTYQQAITLTTTGSSGASTFISNTLNIPNYSLSGLGGVPTSRQLTINGTAYDLSADRTWSVGTVTSVAALTIGTSGTDLSSTVATGTTTPVITLNVPTASATNRGALSSADWTTFNNKQSALTFSSPLVNTSGTISIPAATGSVNGYLTSTDWTTFNSKEPAITAGTSLQYYRGDKTFQTLNTSVVPESGSVYFTEPRVLATVLTGLNLSGGGTIAATDSVLTAFGKIQNQISGIAGGVSYQTTWNASTNTPTLTSSVGTKGYYYVVSVAGSTNLNGITDWKVGDWAIFNGTTWDKVDNTDAVSSVNGFTGAVNLGLGDISNVTLTSPTNGQLLQFNGTSSKWVNWTPTYISGNQTITLSGDISGSGTTAITTTIGALKVTNAMLAGTIDYAKMDATTVPTWNQNTTGSAATLTTARTLTIGATGKSFNGSANVSWSLAEIGAFANPMTTLGDIIYGGASGAATRLAGNTVASKRFLTQTGDGTNSAAPSWGSIAAADVPTLNQNTTGSAATLTYPRNFTINGSAKSFDGSSNISWTAAEIGLTSYLPLSGGTLTGALSGTSASFSSFITAQSTGGSGLRIYGSSGTNQWDMYLNSTNLRFSDNTGTGSVVFDRPLSGTSATFSGGVDITGTTSNQIRLRTAATEYYQIGRNASTGLLEFYGSQTGYTGYVFGGVDGTRLTISSTGAATFSSSVTATSGTFASTNYVNGVFQRTTGNGALIEFKNYATTTQYNWFIGASYNNSNAFEIIRSTAADNDTPGTSSLFTIASTGAATFSSSVTAASAYLSNPLGLNVGGYNFYSQTVSGAMGILGHNLRANNSVANQVDVVNSGWYSSMIKMYYSEGITFHTSATSYNAGDVYPIAATERMRITSGGNVGIGTTSPSTILQANFSSATAYTSGATGNGLLLYNTSATNNQYVGIVLQGEPTSGNAGQATIYGTTTGSGAMDLTFSTRGSSVLAERMRITSSGATQIKGTLQTYAPGSSSVLGDTWKLGGFTNTSVLATTGYLYVQVNGADYYIGLVTPL